LRAALIRILSTTIAAADPLPVVKRGICPEGYASGAAVA
jgi:hypothetical protein